MPHHSTKVAGELIAAIERIEKELDKAYDQNGESAKVTVRFVDIVTILRALSLLKTIENSYKNQN